MRLERLGLAYGLYPIPIIFAPCNHHLVAAVGAKNQTPYEIASKVDIEEEK
jgi:hypothetical protein